MSDTFVLDVLIAGAILTSLSALLYAGIGRVSAAHRHRFLLATAGALVLLPLAVLSVPKSFFLGISSGAPSTDLPALTSEGSATESMLRVTPAGPRPSQQAAWRVASRIWIIGALVQGSLLVISLMRLHLLRRRSRHVDSGSLHAAFVETCRAVGLRRAPNLYVGAQLPLVWGVFRPCIFLPNCVSYWTPRGLRNVLHHELAHIRRRDHGAILLAHLALVVHWPNPLVWFLRWFMERDREFACDAQVLADGVEAESYGRTLVELVKCVQNPVQPRVAAAWNCRLLQARLLALGGVVRQPRMASIAVLAIVWTTTFSLASVSASLTSGYAPNEDFHAIRRTEIPVPAAKTFCRFVREHSPPGRVRIEPAKTVARWGRTLASVDFRGSESHARAFMRSRSDT